MRRFCTQCGTECQPDARFCDACGKALKPHTGLAAANKFVPAPAAISCRWCCSPRKVRWGLGALAVMLVVSFGGYYLWQPPAASPEVLAEAIRQSMAAHPDGVEDKVCLANFDYQRNPVFTNGLDSQTNQWMAELVRLGLYASPQQVNDGFLVQYRYNQTAKGIGAIRHGRLCLAQGIKLVAVTDFSPPQQAGEFRVTRVRYRYDLQAPAAWVSPMLRQALFQGDALPSDSTLVILKQRTWQVPDAEDMKALNLALTRQALAEVGLALGQEQLTHRGGMLQWLKSLFSPKQQADENP